MVARSVLAVNDNKLTVSQHCRRPPPCLLIAVVWNGTASAQTHYWSLLPPEAENTKCTLNRKWILQCFFFPPATLFHAYEVCCSHFPASMLIEPPLSVIRNRCFYCFRDGDPKTQNPSGLYQGVLLPVVFSSKLCSWILNFLTISSYLLHSNNSPSWQCPSC